MILFELFNNPTNFQDYINKILAKEFNIFVNIYLENIFIYIKNLNQVYIKAVK